MVLDTYTATVKQTTTATTASRSHAAHPCSIQEAGADAFGDDAAAKESTLPCAPPSLSAGRDLSCVSPLASCAAAHLAFCAVLRGSPLLVLGRPPSEPSPGSAEASCSAIAGGFWVRFGGAMGINGNTGVEALVRQRGDGRHIGLKGSRPTKGSPPLVGWNAKRGQVELDRSRRPARPRSRRFLPARNCPQNVAPRAATCGRASRTSAAARIGGTCWPPAKTTPSCSSDHTTAHRRRGRVSERTRAFAGRGCGETRPPRPRSAAQPASITTARQEGSTGLLLWR